MDKRDENIALAEKKGLLSGKLEVTDISNIGRILIVCTPGEAQKVKEMMIRTMASGKTSILQYADILGLKKDDQFLPDRIADDIESMMPTLRKSQNQEIRRLVSKLYAEINRVKRYSSAFKKGDVKRIGYADKDGTEHMLTVDDEIIKLATDYLNATGEFVCYKTMCEALRAIHSGKVTPETVASAQKYKQMKDILISNTRKRKLISVIEEPKKETEEQEGQEK